MTHKTIIISPQGGLGNRLRAVNSALIAAEELGYQIKHAWHSSEPNHNVDFINRLKHFSFSHFFEENFILPADKNQEINSVISQCAPGDYWYETHSSAQKKYSAYCLQRSRNTMQELRKSTHNNILIETTLRFWPRNYPGIHETTLNQADSTTVSKAYQKLVPKRVYLDIADKIEPAEIGLWIRAGDLADYYPNARQDIKKIAEWIKYKFSTKSIAIFSNDINTQDFLYKECELQPPMGYLSEEVFMLPPHQKAFLEFLYLANNCNKIYGTPGSSFGQESALFNLKPYHKILS